MEIVNLTPHRILELTTATIFEVSGQVCRVQTVQEEIARIQNIPVYATKATGVVEGLPSPKTDTIYIVSALANSLLQDRKDVVTVGMLTKDNNGNVIGCTGFRQ